MATKPSKSEPRIEVRALRFRPGGIAAVQAIAERDGLSWTEAIRRIIKYGVANMPKGWH